jgi:predicted metal-dependent peptidase
MGEYPFFALLLMYLKFVAVPGMKKISTNGKCVYFSPDFLEKLNYKELDYVLCHQILHIVSGHIWREQDLAGDDYHFACDIFVNLILEDYGFYEERYPHLGYLYRQMSGSIDLRGKSPEEICGLMPYSLYAFNEDVRSKFLMDNEYWWDHKDDNGQSGEIIIDLPEIEGRLKDSKDGATSQADGEGDDVDGENGSVTMQIWQARTVALAKTLERSSSDNGGISTVPDFVKRMIDKMKEPVLDWKKILNNFLQESICDYSFSPPDRRFSDTGFFLPDFNEKDFVSKDILFMVDTSGSIDDYDLAAVYSEIRGAIEQFGGKLSGKLGFFDTWVTLPIAFDNVDDLMRIMPYGGGGTDFRVIFEYIKHELSNELPACVVIFTDGHAPYPSQSETMNIPVLWIINNEKITPPWGKVIRVISSQK